jgi:tRNA G37 N-methylase TrmD
MRDWFNEEIDEFDDCMINNGYCFLLNMDQIEDVIDNIKQQKAQPSEQELLEAIIFYYERDAFISL